MAQTGVHVECGFAVAFGGQTLFYPIWSETIAVGGTTTQSARGTPGSEFEHLTNGILIFRCTAPDAAPVYVARGTDASQAIGSSSSTYRAHLAAGETKDIPTRPNRPLSSAAG